MRGIDVGLVRGGRAAVVVAVTLAVALALLAVPSARATTVSQDITSSAGPLTNIWLGNDLDCQAQYTGQTAYEFYPTASAPGDCGTFVSITAPSAAHRAALYGPDLATNPDQSATTRYLKDTAYTSVQQSGVTGSGTTADPYSVTTEASAGSSGLIVDETDSYIVGDTAYRTDITLRDTANTGLIGRLYHAADCNLPMTGSGYGEFNASTSAVACTASVDNAPPGPVQEFAPLTTRSHYVEGYFCNVWEDVAAQSDLPDTCDCTGNTDGTAEDNGEAVNWDYMLRPGGSETFSMLTNFSPSRSARGTSGQPDRAVGRPGRGARRRSWATR